MAMGKGVEKKSLLAEEEELISEILVKLPVKSLVRFRCVCKAWYRLIKSPNFINLHLKRTQKKNECFLITQGVLIREGCTKLLSFHSCESLGVGVVISPAEDVKVPHLVQNPEVSLPCNGLIFFWDHKNIVLGNPAMREFKVLPRPYSFQFRDLLFVAGGLGFDSSKNEYKVVAGFINGIPNSVGGETKTKVIAEVYNLSSNSWRQIEYDFKYVCDCFPCAPQLNGVLHWPASRNGIKFIICFDLSKEVFGEMELPNDVAVPGMKIQISIHELNERLAVFAEPDQMWSQQPVSDHFVDIWVMKEYGVTKSWSKQATVGPIQGLKLGFHLHMVWKNEAILGVYTEEDGENLSVYGVDTHQITNLGIPCEDVMRYQESLMSIT